MAFSLADFQKLQAKVDKARKEQARLEGARDQLQKQLQEEFGCKTLVQAEQKLVKMDEQIGKLSAQYEKAETELKTKWDSKL